MKWKQQVPDIFCKHSGALQGKHDDVKFTWPKPTGVESMDLENNSIMTEGPQECC